jgi:hypothetical protein
MTQTQILDHPIAKLGIVSCNDLAHRLGVKLEKLHEIADQAASFYRPFDFVPRPRPFQRKAAPDPRPIDRPVGDLKAIQKKVNSVLLRPLVFPPHVMGAVPCRSILDNSAIHVGARLLVTVDVRRCFPSISNKQIYRVWKDTLGCSAKVSALLTRLTTFERRLPQGAPTSPLLANVFIWSIDGPIRAECTRLGLVYSTWIDDLAFSGMRAREIVQVAIETLASERLAVSRYKIRIMGPRAVKLLTGARLGRDRPRAPHELTARVRSALHKLEGGVIPPTDEEQYVQHLKARIRHIERVCSDDVRTFYRGGVSLL